MPFDLTYFMWAVAIGGLSAVSLPAGSAFGLITRPRATTIAIMTAFGAGALLAALTIVLVAPVVLALVSHGGGGEEAHGGSPVNNFIALLIGAVIGGLLFVLLDQLLNAQGGFLRKNATSISWFSTTKRERVSKLLADLNKIKLLHHITGEYVDMLVNAVTPVDFKDGETLFEEGDLGDRLYFIREGEIELYQGGRHFKDIGGGEVIGELALLTGAPRTARAKAKGWVKALVLMKTDFDRIRQASPELDQAVRELAGERMDELSRHSQEHMQKTTGWIESAAEAVRKGTQVPTRSEVNAAKGSHGGATLGIWLGIMLDGIPESFVIGTHFLAVLAATIASGGEPSLLSVIPYTLIAGLFLSNFPEAMSSSVLMYESGWNWPKVLFMWSTIFIVTMIGAGIGYATGGLLPYVFVVGIQGVAAGAMLTMISSTMLPEAVHFGSPSSVGLSTLGGFLGAIAFQLFE